MANPISANASSVLSKQVWSLGMVLRKEGGGPICGTTTSRPNAAFQYKKKVPPSANKKKLFVSTAFPTIANPLTPTSD